MGNIARATAEQQNRHSAVASNGSTSGGAVGAPAKKKCGGQSAPKAVDGNPRLWTAAPRGKASRRSVSALRGRTTGPQIDGAADEASCSTRSCMELKLERSDALFAWKGFLQRRRTIHGESGVVKVRSITSVVIKGSCETCQITAEKICNNLFPLQRGPKVVYERGQQKRESLV
jgi:hypothetical protein